MRLAPSLALLALLQAAAADPPANQQYYNPPTQTTEDSVACKKAYETFINCVAFDAESNAWAPATTCLQQVQSAFASCPGADYLLRNPERDITNTIDLAPYAVVGGLDKHGNIQGFYKVPGSHNNQAKELNCKTCANYGKEAAQCALPIALPTATPTPQQIQQAMFQTGLRCIGPDPVKQSLQRIFNPMGDQGFVPGITTLQGDPYITFIQGYPLLSLSQLTQNCPNQRAAVTATSNKGNKLAVTTQKASSSDNAAVPFDTTYQAYAYYGGLTQTMKDKPACRRALKRFAACIQVGANGQWVDPAACWSQVSAALSACPAVDYNLFNPARQTFNYTDIPAYAVMGSLKKDGRVQGFYKVPAASTSKLYPLSCSACVKLEETLAKCTLPTPVAPGATEAQIYDALFRKGAVCLGADPRLQALQDICAKTLAGYEPQLTGNEITFVKQTAAVRLSTLMENCPTGYAYVGAKGGGGARKIHKGSTFKRPVYTPTIA